VNEAVARDQTALNSKSASISLAGARRFQSCGRLAPTVLESGPEMARLA